ncbi:histidine phosphatase family protein [Spirochaeta dissipatitropha]
MQYALTTQSKPDFSRLNKRLRVYIVRHGESEGNSQGILQGQKDYPLSELGRQQSKSAAEHLSDLGIELVLSSPLLRTRETADIITAANEYPAAILDDRLMELDTGIFTGMTIREIEREMPAEWAAFRRKSWEAVPQAEPISSLWERAVDIWNSIIDAANDGRRHILVITHAGFIQWLIKTSFGARPEWIPLMPTDNCGIYEFLAYPIPEAGAAEENEESEKSYYASWVHLNKLPY